MAASSFVARYDLPSIHNPGMITEEEEHLYFHLAKEFWAPDRTFIECGTWLGRSTQRICQGLDAASTGNWKLVCYDRFKWHSSYTIKANRGSRPNAVADLNEGDSFEEAFLTLMGEYRHSIETYAGSIGQSARILGEVLRGRPPIGVLFVDASKSWDNCYLLSAVAPHLTHAKRASRIVFQDFYMNSAYNLQLLLMLSTALEPEITTIRDGGSLVFKVVSEIDPQHRYLRPNARQEIGEDEIREAFERLRATIPASRFVATQLSVTLPLLLRSGGFIESADQAAMEIDLSPDAAKIMLARFLKHPKIAFPALVKRVHELVLETK